MKIIILTPLAVEYQAVKQHLTGVASVRHDEQLYTSGQFRGRHHVYEVLLRETGSKNTVIALAAEQAIRSFHPVVALLVGVAGGVKDVRAGDIVVGTKAYGYESGKETDGGSVARPEVLPFSPALIEAAREIGRNRDWQKRAGSGASGAQVFFGPIASGDKVIATTSSPLYHYLQQHYNDTTAVEMESIGFAQAVLPYRRVHALNIRAISDLLADKPAADNGGGQVIASERAAAFAMELLYQLDCSPFILPNMELKTLVQEIAGYIFPLMKMEAAREIGSDFKDATNGTIRELWQKVKPWFIEEVAELKADPEATYVEGAVQYKLKKELEGKADLQAELEWLLEKAKAAPGGGAVHVLNSKNVLVGNRFTVGGDFRVGDTNSDIIDSFSK